MSTPDNSAGQPSDKLVPPLNAPSSGAVSTGIQPGVTNGVVLAQYVVVFGATGGVFIYAGTPFNGNPPIYSISNADADPYGNSVYPGIWAGQKGGIQAGMQVQGSSGQVIFPTPGTFADFPIIAAEQSGSGSIFQIFGGKNAASGPTSDRAVFAVFDNISGGGAAAAASGYFDANGNFTYYLFITYSGAQLTGQVYGIQPGTGTSVTNPGVAETWHTAALVNGWAGSGNGVNGLRYRLIADNAVEVIADIQHPTSTGSVCAVLPAGYRPSYNMNFPCGWNNPQSSNSASAPWLFISTGGNVQITSIQSVNHEIFFCQRFPLGTLP